MAFTLIEMILVLVVLAIALAVTVPSLSGWGARGKLRNAAQEFLAATQFARSQAAATAKTHRIEIDAATGRYAVSALGEDGTTWSPAFGEFGSPTVPSRGITLAVSGGENAGAILFYPNGRATPATVSVRDAAGDTIDIASTAPAEPFRMMLEAGR